MAHGHICGLYYLVKPTSPYSYGRPDRHYLPQVSLAVHAHIIASTSRTTLTQTFVNPSKTESISELRYTFPLYDGVSVVGFTCTINRDRVIKGVVKERAEARKTFDAAVTKGETAGLFEQLPEASDVFTTTIGNVPAGADIQVDITYLGELKHDAEADGIRFTIPTHIAPRYGSYPGQMLQATNVTDKAGIKIVVDAEVPDNSQIKNVQSPSHPISVTIGNTSVGAASGADMSLQKASATLALGTAELGSDFVLHVVATNTENPTAVVETHPSIPNHRALMATLVPKFNLPSSRPEVVFLCDRSGSMCSGNKIPNMKTALHLFLKSLPVGLKFNICSFGSSYELLFKDGSKSYDESTLKQAAAYVDTFSSNFGGTEMYQPLEEIFKRRFTDMNLEVFLLTDGEIWDQERLFTMINKYIAESKGAIRVFTLGIGSDVSHALIEGVARAGNGFSQAVGDNEKMNSKVVRMLKASLTPHVADYTLEVKYNSSASAGDDDDFEIIEKVMDSLAIDVTPESKPTPKAEAKKIISLFDKSADPDVEMVDESLDKTAGGKYSHVPAIAEPKLLQAPFEIPPLFPFNRTSVYLLMSPESVAKTPKSIVLRGTSQHGPLELEIPITTLAQTGETIHQLAARKAVKELEEGRGWIYHAKGVKDGGKLLRDKYPGLFSDMVEREAVRLGVTYQVGGKNCSFVAVENNDKGSPPPPAYEKRGTYHDYFDQVLDSTGSDLVECFDEGFALFGGGGSYGRRCHFSYEAEAVGDDSSDGEMGFGMFDGPSGPGVVEDKNSIHSEAVPPRMGVPAMGALTMSGLSSASLAAVNAAPAPAPSMRMRVARNSFGATPCAAPAHGPGGGPYYPAPPPPPPGGLGSAMMSHARQSEDFASPASAPAPTFSSSNTAAQDNELQLMLLEQQNKKRLMMAPSEQHVMARPHKEMKPHPQQHAGDQLETIVGHQTFAGFWTWDAGLLYLVGLNAAAVDNKVKSLGFGWAVGTEMLATAVVIVFLKEKLASREDEWEMVADKARDWLERELQAKGTGVSAKEFVENIRGVLRDFWGF